VKVDFTASAGGKVRFDADALGQILGNLFSNVEKYAGAGGVLSVTSRQAGETTTIVIADNGPGIPESQQENVFAPFTRLRNELTEGVTGTGIGLSIARDLARLHGGDLRLLPGSPGAAFELTMKTPAASAEGAFE
jgi:signal transduction histidine kinase